METTNANVWVDALKTLYIEGEYDNAEKLLLSKKELYSLGAFHFNMGTLKVKKGDLGLARYNFEKALAEGYIGSQVFHNLNLVKEKIQVNDISASKFWKDRALDNLGMVSPHYYFGLTLLLLIFTFFLMRINLLKSTKKIISVAVIALMPSIFQLTYLDKIRFAVVLEESGIYEGPSKIFTEIKMLDEGSKLIVKQKNGRWYFIVSPLSMTGWISKDKIALY
jgi:hypothetical protein